MSVLKNYVKQRMDTNTCQCVACKIKRGEIVVSQEDYNENITSQFTSIENTLENYSKNVINIIYLVNVAIRIEGEKQDTSGEDIDIFSEVVLHYLNNEIRDNKSTQTIINLTELEEELTFIMEVDNLLVKLSLELRKIKALRAIIAVSTSLKAVEYNKKEVVGIFYNMKDSLEILEEVIPKTKLLSTIKVKNLN